MVLLAGELEEGSLHDTGVIDPAGFDEQTVTDCHFRCLLGVFCFFFLQQLGVKVNLISESLILTWQVRINVIRRAQMPYGHRS